MTEIGDGIDVGRLQVVGNLPLGYGQGSPGSQLHLIRIESNRFNRVRVSGCERI